MILGTSLDERDMIRMFINGRRKRLYLMKKKKNEGRQKNIWRTTKMLNRCGERSRGANIEAKAHVMRLREHGDLPHQSRPIPLDYPNARQQTRKIAHGPSAAGLGNILTARVTRKTAAARINSNRHPHSPHRSSASLFSDQDSANAAQQCGKQREQGYKRSTTPLIHHTHLRRQRRYISSPTKHVIYVG